MNSNPNILALETSGRIGSVALASGPTLKAVGSFRSDFNHAAELLPTVAELCRRLRWRVGDLNHLYLSVGPGSFTGLRIAATMARTLSWSADLKTVAVPTVDVLAQNALEFEVPPDHLTVILDAKRRQIYAATFELHEGAYQKIIDACVVDPVEFLGHQPQPLSVLGEGIKYHLEALQRVAHEKLPETLWRPRAEAVHRLGFDRAQRGRFTDPSTLVPVYLRLPEAEEVWRKKRGMAR